MPEKLASFMNARKNLATGNSIAKGTLTGAVGSILIGAFGFPYLI